MSTLSLAARKVADRLPGRETLHATAVLQELGLEGATLPIEKSVAGAEPSPADPSVLGRFRILRELGAGGMGRVLEASDPELRRTVAIKVLRDADTVTEAQIRRFIAEAQITAQLDHPNIVPVHELGITPDGEAFIVMKRVRGMSMRSILDGLATNDPAITARWSKYPLLMSMPFICGAVAYAHDRGVIHRDLKPDNIMYGEFMEVLVMDWGVSRLVGDLPEEVQAERIDRVVVNRTMDGSAIGTPGYMSPEQAYGRLDRLDGRSDVFSLGAILYEIVTLKPAFVGNTPIARMLQAVQGPPLDPRVRAPDQDVHDELAEICMKAMAMEPDERFPTPRHLAFAIGQYLAKLGHTERCESHDPV